MPSVSENLRVWSTDWDWSSRGEEWSHWWGGTPAMWYGALLPRIHPMLPTGTALEIAPGYGRWTRYLKDLSRELDVVDLTAECIEHCRHRFAEATNIRYHVNDGRSLAMIEDGSIDFAFSFDSLVHADPDVVGGYVSQLADKLSPNGVAFLHHSNAGAYRRLAAVSRWLPARVSSPLVRKGVALHLAAWRDEKMTAALLRRQCARAGLACVSQELVSWQFGGYLIDCFSVFTRRGSAWERPLRVWRNPLFVSEARRMGNLYAATSYPGLSGHLSA